MRRRARHVPIFRTAQLPAPGPGELVLTVRRKRYIVHARPHRHPVGGGGRFTFGAGGPQHIAPGTCDEYEGDGGHLYVCCRSHDGLAVNCYRIVHQDPWIPS